MSLEKSKVISIFKRMDKDEFNDFGKYIRCKYHNQRQQVIKLFDYCKRYYPNFEQKRFSKELAFKKLYPNEAFNAKKINNTLFHLGERLNDYLLLQELKNSKRTQQHLMMNALERKNLDKLFYKHLNQWENDLEQSTIKEPWVYQDLQEINFRRFTYVNYDKRQSSDDTFQKALTYFDQHFVTEKTRLSLLTTIRHQLLNQALDLKLVNAANDYIENYPLNNPIITIYQKLHQLLLHPNEAEYLDCKELIIKYLDSTCSKQEKEQWLELLLNFGIKQMTLGNQAYRRHNLELSKIAIPLKIFHHDRILPDVHFMNTIVMGKNYPNEYEWLIDFIETYKHNLAPEKREALVLLAYAHLNFEKKAYEDVIQSLYQVDLYHFDMNLMARTISIKAITEMELTKGNYYTSLISACDAHIKFIKRHNELPIRRKETNLNFISSLRLIMKNTGQYINSEIRQSLSRKIKATPSFGQEWLLSIVQRL